MPSTKALQTAELAAVLAAEASAHVVGISKHLTVAPQQIAADAIALIRIAGTVQRWAERACNGEGKREYRGATGGYRWTWDSEDEAKHARADTRALAKAQTIADRYGAKVVLGGDPRGFTMWLILASGRGNTSALNNTPSWGISA